MRHDNIASRFLVGTGAILAACAALSQEKSSPSSGVPLMEQLYRFTSADVPALAPAEAEVAPRQWDQPIPSGLPGKGLAEHPMLYIGEGYNKMFLVNDGKIIWTYSTGKGNEYDDVWMLSNGNILFTRMQYVAEVTPKKDVVWRYDAPEGTEIHACQPIRTGSCSVCPQRPAAQADGRQHQDGRR